MFTGIVETLAPIVDIQALDKTTSGGGGFSITIGECQSILSDCHIGDSICVNGTCLTVTEFDAGKGTFKIGVAPETLRRTNLGDLKVGDGVNCERAMQAHTRFGGHFVQGHVDTTAILRSVVPTGNALTLCLRLSRSDLLPKPSALSPYLIPKGYVTLDGASLTLIDVSPPEGGRLDDGRMAGATTDEAGGAADPRETVEFSVMLIKHTQDAIGLSKKKPGQKVNVELDMVGKFVHRAVLGEAAAASASSEGGKGVDAGAAEVGLETNRDALTALVERTVRKVLAEKS